jgi:hypothetical protein
MRSSENSSPVAYGYVDESKTIIHDAAFHEAIKPVAKLFRLGTHTVKDASGSEVSLAVSPDVKVYFLRKVEL